MTFTTTNLSHQRVLVEGQDHRGTHGTTVLDGAEWAAIKAELSHADAHDDFDAAIEAFFAPLTEAAEKLSETHSGPDLDPSEYIVLQRGEAATEAVPEEVITLSRDSQILRLIEEGSHERLIWVQEQLEVMAPGNTTLHPTFIPSDEFTQPDAEQRSPGSTFGSPSQRKRSLPCSND